jgi:tRNA A37 threonylcarbamoyladenosine synthetase subunit TsaC/SUA5/YrdC
LQKQLDLVIDGGYCGAEPTTVVDLTGDEPEVRRLGKGDPTPFQ